MIECPEAAAARPLTVPEAAALARCSPRSVRRRIAAGELAATRLGGKGRLLIDPLDLAAAFRPARGE